MTYYFSSEILHRLKVNTIYVEEQEDGLLVLRLMIFFYFLFFLGTHSNSVAFSPQKHTNEIIIDDKTR